VNILNGKTTRSPRPRRDGNIKIYVKEIMYTYLGLIHLLLVSGQ